MRSLVLLLAVLALGGCMNVSDMGEGVRYHMSDAGLLDHSDSRRVNNLRIQPDSFIYIAQGAFAPPGSAYPRPNVVAEEAFNGFIEYFPMVRRARVPEGLDQAMGEARPPVPIICCTPASPRLTTASATLTNGRMKKPWIAWVSIPA